jgi:hypothetical protein
MAFLTSPGVNTSEIDLTTSIPAVGTSTGATVGFFRWGPANSVIQISSENDLVTRFFKPDNTSAPSFLCAANFLAYGNDLRLVRAINDTMGDTNATYNAQTSTAANVIIRSDEDYTSTFYNAASNTSVSWAARYPGALGNALQVSICASNTAFTNWAYAPYFDQAPATSPYATSATGSTNLQDELHMVVVDQDGLFTGVANTILEKYVGLSKASDAKSYDGSSNYYKEVLFRKSSYIHWLGHQPNNGTSNAWGQSVATVFVNSTTFHSPASANTVSLTNGTDGSPTQAQVINALDIFSNKEKHDISLIFAGTGLATVNTSIDLLTVSNKVITIADTRKDCVGFISPSFAN